MGEGYVVILNEDDLDWLHALVMHMGEKRRGGPSEWESDLQGKLLSAPTLSPTALEVVKAVCEGSFDYHKFSIGESEPFTWATVYTYKPKPKSCPECGDVGEDYQTPEVSGCPTCKGTGEVREGEGE